MYSYVSILGFTRGEIYETKKEKIKAIKKWTKETKENIKKHGQLKFLVETLKELEEEKKELEKRRK